MPKWKGADMPVLEQDAIDAGKDFLEHYGIMGMKWGIRRKDPSGGSSGSSSTKGAKNLLKKETTDKSIKKDRKQAVKNRRKLTETDLQNRIRRNQLEKQLKDSTAENLRPKRTAAKRIIGNTAKTVATAALPGLATYVGRKLIKKYMKNDALANEVFPPKTKKGKGAQDAGKAAVETIIRTNGSVKPPTFAQSAKPRS